MSRVRLLLSQPISDDDRPRLFALVAAALLAVAGMLTVLAPAGEHESSNATRSSVTAPVAAPAPARVAPTGPPAVVAFAGRAFLADYLAFVHGHAGRRPAFRYASAALARRLGGYRLRISPAARQRRPRVLRLTVRRLAGQSRWVVTATIADGGVATYPIELVVALRDGRPVVTQVGEE